MPQILTGITKPHKCCMRHLLAAVFHLIISASSILKMNKATTVAPAQYILERLQSGCQIGDNDSEWKTEQLHLPAVV